MKRSDNAVILAFVIVAVGALVGNIITTSWTYGNDGLCDACGSRYTMYYVKTYGTGNVSPKVTNEFCSDHAFLWGLFNPWAPAEGLYGLHWITLLVLFLIVFGFSFMGFSIRERILGSKRQRISKAVVTLAFILGFALFVGGIAQAFTDPGSPLVWEGTSQNLSSENVMEVPARWKTVNKSFEVVLESYNGWSSAWSPFVENGEVDDRWEGRNFKIDIRAIEQSSPQMRFSFYAFDYENYSLWIAGLPCTTLYRAEGKTSIDITLPISDEKLTPLSMFCFVAMPFLSEEQPVILFTVVASWVEEESICFSSFSGDLSTSTSGSFLKEQNANETKGFELKGSAAEASGRAFNFYIFNDTEFWRWSSNESYNACFQMTNVTTVSFSIPLSKEEALTRFHFVAENPLVDTDERVKLSAVVQWSRVTGRRWLVGGLVSFLGGMVMISAGPPTALALSRSAQSLQQSARAAKSPR